MSRLMITIATALALSGCATTSVPERLLTCMDHPRSPGNDPAATESDAANYTVLLSEAGADCRSKLGEVRRLLTETRP